MKRWVFLASVLLETSLGLAAQAGDDKAAEAYRAMFGEEERKVALSAGRKDDVEFAGKLLDAAGKVADDPALRVLLYEKAYEFGLRDAAGYPLVVDAMRRLIEAQPARRAEYRRKLLEAYEARYLSARGPEQAGVARELAALLCEQADADAEAGSFAEAISACKRAYAIASRLRLRQGHEIARRLKVLLAREPIEKEKARLAGVLRDKPDDRAAADRLLVLYLVEDDDPAKAGELLDAAQADEALRLYIPLARKAWHELAEAAALELAQWYRQWAEKASDHGRPKMLARARAYYQTYLALHRKRDAPALKAQLELAKVEELLAKGGEPDGAFPGPPRDVTAEIVAWAKQRDALPAQEQVQALARKLSEVNDGREIQIQNHETRDGRPVFLEFWEQKNLVNIAPLFGMKLTRLHLGRTSITHVEPLRGMPLERLGLRDTNKLESLKGLEGMPLEELAATGTQVRDLLPLRGMKLVRLDLSYCTALEGIEPLAGMPLVELRMFHATRVPDVEPLRGMRLQVLDLSWCNRISDLDPLRGMPLRELYMAARPVTDLSDLAGMPLRVLDLKGCGKLQSLKGIEELPLEELDLSNTPFANVKAAQQLKARIPTLKAVRY